MKLQDKETLNVADTVKDVLEGKKAVKEMDPKKHVSKKGDKFVVVNKNGDEVKSFDSEDEANKYAVDNHDDLMKEGPEEPRAKGEKDFKDKHTVKKSGMKDDGSNVKEETEETEEVEEAYHSKEKKKKEEGNAFGKAVMAAKEKGEKTFVFAGKKYKVTGEEVVEELSDKQKKYRAFFDKALKKFKVSSPSELKGDKKKEFFDYVDANYEADNESD
jgi:hypothetical protein